jgi:hypothetical protein
VGHYRFGEHSFDPPTLTTLYDAFDRRPADRNLCCPVQVLLARIFQSKEVSVKRQPIVLAAAVLASIPALSQDAKDAATPDSECAARFKAADKNKDGYITRTELPDAHQMPSSLAKESLITPREYIAACAKLSAAQPQRGTDASISPETNGKQQPQGPTGPLETKSGGAPAESPQGQTPPGMQPAPNGSSQTIIDPSRKE